MWDQLIDLWKLDTIQSLPLRDLNSAVDEAKALVEGLSEAWQAYQQDPTGRGNFEDAQAWADLDMPAKELGDDGGKKKKKDEDLSALLSEGLTVGKKGKGKK